MTGVLTAQLFRLQQESIPECFVLLNNHPIFVSYLYLSQVDLTVRSCMAGVHGFPKKLSVLISLSYPE